ncbi:enolase C-terminal domain-like protein [Lipomyces mesembrius]
MPKIAEIEYFLTDVDGNYGWGEASVEKHTEFKSRFIGWEANNIEHIWHSVWRMGFYRGGPVLQSALSGLDIALWDLKGVRDKVKVYAWIGGDRPDDVKQQALARLAQGFKAVKMNATADIDLLDAPASLDSAADRLATVKSLGMDAGVDFHGRIYKPMAKQLAKLLEEHRPMFIEEPLLSEHHEGIAELSQLTTFLNPTIIDVLQPDISHVGGISEIKKISAMCEAYDIAIAPHCPLGSIALAACLQIAASTPNHVIQEMSLGIHYNIESGEEDIGTYVHIPQVFDVSNGYVNVADGPGLGIQINEKVVRKLSQKAKPWRSGSFVAYDGSFREW